MDGQVLVLATIRAFRQTDRYGSSWTDRYWSSPPSGPSGRLTGTAPLHGRTDGQLLILATIRAFRQTDRYGSSPRTDGRTGTGPAPPSGPSGRLTGMAPLHGRTDGQVLVLFMDGQVLVLATIRAFRQTDRYGSSSWTDGRTDRYWSSPPSGPSGRLTGTAPLHGRTDGQLLILATIRAFRQTDRYGSSSWTDSHGRVLVLATIRAFRQTDRYGSSPRTDGRTGTGPRHHQGLQADGQVRLLATDGRTDRYWSSPPSGPSGRRTGTAPLHGRTGTSPRHHQGLQADGQVRLFMDGQVLVLATIRAFRQTDRYGSSSWTDGRTATDPRHHQSLQADGQVRLLATDGRTDRYWSCATIRAFRQTDRYGSSSWTDGRTGTGPLHGRTGTGPRHHQGLQADRQVRLLFMDGRTDGQVLVLATIRAFRQTDRYGSSSWTDGRTATDPRHHQGLQADGQVRLLFMDGQPRTGTGPRHHQGLQADGQVRLLATDGRTDRYWSSPPSGPSGRRTGTAPRHGRTDRQVLVLATIRAFRQTDRYGSSSWTDGRTGTGPLHHQGLQADGQVRLLFMDGRTDRYWSSPPSGPSGRLTGTDPHHGRTDGRTGTGPRHHQGLQTEGRTDGRTDGRTGG